MTLQEIDKIFYNWLDEKGYGEFLMAKLEEQERQKWSQVVADKDAQIARLQAELDKRRQSADSE